MKFLTPALIALGITFAGAFAGPTLAQTSPTAPAAPTSPATPTSIAPAGVVDTAAKVAAPAEQRPIAGIGQPIDAEVTLQTQVTANGQFAEWMHNVVLMPIITFISVFVLGLLLWVVVRYRRSANLVPSKTAHNTTLEVAWTLIPVILLVGISIPSIGLLARQYKPVGANAITIKAIGNQWYWTYEYPDHGGFEIVANMLSDEQAKAKGEPRLLAVDNRIVVPVGTDIRLLTTSNDVLHAWAMPAFWVKMDAVPGRINETNFNVQKAGVYYGQCSELCGARHAFMPIAVEAVSKETFAQWVAAKGGTMPGAKPAMAPAASAGQQQVAVPVDPGSGASPAPSPTSAATTPPAK